MQASLEVWNARNPLKPHIYMGEAFTVSYKPERTCRMWIADGSQGVIGMGLTVKDACTAYKGALELMHIQRRHRHSNGKRKVLPDPLLPFPRKIGNDGN